MSEVNSSVNLDEKLQDITVRRAFRNLLVGLLQVALAIPQILVSLVAAGYDGLTWFLRRIMPSAKDTPE